MHEIKMGRALSIVERTRKICYSGRQGSLISQNPPALAVGSMSILTLTAVQSIFLMVQMCYNKKRNKKQEVRFIYEEKRA